MNIIHVSGFWKEDQAEFEGYKCKQLEQGDPLPTGDEPDDDEIFYYFDPGEPVIGDCGDFTITSYEQQDGAVITANPCQQGGTP